MPDTRPSLSDWSTRELLREVARRAEVAASENALPAHWCTDCKHFKFVTKKVPDSHNCCTKKHAMQFRMGDHPEGDDTGFYLDGCLDFEARRVVALPPIKEPAGGAPPLTPDWRGKPNG